ncbi:hypothetical protein JCM8097_005620 [Rhodosporidiobolus ruineniae]
MSTTTAYPHPDVERGSYGEDRKDASAATSENGHPVDVKNVHTTSGVAHMEAIAKAGYADKSGRMTLYGIALSMFLMYWFYCQAGSTTYLYSVWATSSFAQHSAGISAMGVATGIVGSVCGPFLAKISDVFGRPWLSVVLLLAYVTGYVMLPLATILTVHSPANIVGNVFTTIGGTGLNLLTTVLTADLVPLSWRGFSQGLLSAPYIVIPWYSAEIANALSKPGGWRWGYGMYAIIMPVVMVPGIALLFFLEHRAKKVIAATAAEAVVDYAEKNGHPEAAAPAEKSLYQRIRLAWSELDGFGLLLLGFGWSLLLLPFSLKSTAQGGYSNPSLIAMFVVGAILLPGYAAWEYFGANFPSTPRRLIFNKTFITCIIIDFIYYLAGYIQSAYFSSYVYIVTDYTTKEWTYFENTLTIALCFGGVIAGVITRITRRYKALQIIGLCIKIIAYGLLVDKNGVHDTARLVSSQVLTGIGGSFSVIGSQISSQACVPHQDVALAISVLSLWTGIGGSIGTAIAGAWWERVMPGNLRHYIPVSAANDTMIDTFFEDITSIRTYDYQSEIRQGALRAYEVSVYPLWCASLGLSFIALIAAFFQANYYLDDRQNAFDNKDAEGNVVTSEHRDKIEKKTLAQKILRFWDQ